MSRTTRRKRYDYKTVFCTIYEYVPKYIRGDFWHYKSRVVEISYEIAKQHSDAGYATACNPSKVFRNIHKKAYRGICKAEIHKWMANNEYEVVIQSNPYLPYWD